MPLRDYVRNAAPAAPTLPYIHTTAARNLESVLADGLRPTSCPVFGEPVVYLFYGRPAYKKPIGQDQQYIEPHAPIALIFDPAALVSIKRVYPLDSGAFANGRCDQVAYDGLSLDQMELDPDPETPSRVVTAFFGGNLRYFEGACQPYVAPDAMDFPVGAHIKSVQNPLRNRIDDRRFTVEVSTADAVRLRPHLRAIVLPRVFLTADSVVRFQRDHPKVEPRTYSTAVLGDANGLYERVFHEVYKYLDDYRLWGGGQ